MPTCGLQKPRRRCLTVTQTQCWGHDSWRKKPSGPRTRVLRSRVTHQMLAHGDLAPLDSLGRLAGSGPRFASEFCRVPLQSRTRLAKGSAPHPHRSMRARSQEPINLIVRLRLPFGTLVINRCVCSCTINIDTKVQLPSSRHMQVDSFDEVLSRR